MDKNDRKLQIIYECIKANTSTTDWNTHLLIAQKKKEKEKKSLTKESTFREMEI